MYNDSKAQAEFAAKALKVYEQHRQELETQHAGKIAAIDADSGEYFIGTTLGKANDAAYQKCPDKWVYFVRIGSPGAAIALRTW